VRDKLYEYGMTKDEVEEILSDLISENFLNEERFALQFAGGHFRIKGWGKVKINHALKQKRVSAYNIKKALQSIDLDAYEKTLETLATKKWNSLKGERGLSKMAKTQAFLYQRGFEPQLIQPVIQKLNKKI
jgi:regulatory protein